MTGRERVAIVIILLVIFLLLALAARALLARPRGRHRTVLAPLPAPEATRWDGDDERTSIWLAGLRRAGRACGQAAELRVRAAVVGALLAGARDARRAWGRPAAVTAYDYRYVPPVDVAAARFPFRSRATAPTVP